MTKTKTSILWLDYQSDTWGECHPDDLIVVPSDALTPDEYEALETADDKEAADIIIGAHNRITSAPEN